MQFIENKTFDELKVGDTAELKRTLRKQDIELFAVMSGDFNPPISTPNSPSPTASTPWSRTACGAAR